MGGTQDVFLVFSGGGFNVRSIKFAIVDGRTATDRINATGYAMAKKVNEGAGALANVRDGAMAALRLHEISQRRRRFDYAGVCGGCRPCGRNNIGTTRPAHRKPVCEIPIAPPADITGSFLSQ